MLSLHMFWWLLLFISSNENLVDPRYTQAVNSATEAAYKQSGAESNFLEVKDSVKNNGNRWLRVNGLANVAAVGGAVIPVILYKKIRIKEGNFVFEGVKERATVLWTIQF